MADLRVVICAGAMVRAAVPGQPHARLMFMIQTADPEFKTPPYPDSE